MRGSRRVTPRMAMIIDLSLALEPAEVTRLVWEFLERGLIDPKGYDELKAYFLEGPNRGA